MAKRTYLVFFPEWLRTVPSPTPIRGFREARRFAERVRALAPPTGAADNVRWNRELGEVPGYAGRWPLSGRYVLEVGYESTAGRGRQWHPFARVMREDCQWKDVR